MLFTFRPDLAVGEDLVILFLGVLLRDLICIEFYRVKRAAEFYPELILTAEDTHEVFILLGKPTEKISPAACLGFCFVFP